MLGTIELTDAQVIAVIIGMWVPLIGTIQWARSLVHRVHHDSQEVIMQLVEQLQESVAGQSRFASGVLDRIDRIVANQQAILDRLGKP